MHGLGHRYGDFAIGDLNLAAHLHDIVLRLFSWKMSELDEFSGKFGISDQERASFLCNLNRIPNVIAMTMSQQDVIDFRNCGERIFIVLTFGIGWITQPWIDEQDFSVRRDNWERRMAEPFQFRLLSRSLRRES